MGWCRRQRGLDPGHEKKQISSRLPQSYVRRILGAFNDGDLDAANACLSLEVSRSRLYQLRTAWLRDRTGYHSRPSGGDHEGVWPQPVQRFLEGFPPLQNPPNYQLVADEMERLCGFHRARSSVEAYVKKHLAGLVPCPPRRVRPYRRFRCAHAGELWQHDSSIHQWWPDAAKQTLLLSVDDHSRLIVGGRFVRSDTTENHFCHFRGAFEQHGLPAAVYTDGLSLFGASSTDDKSDPRSEFQRALSALGVAPRLAPTPQAKGKIERRFGTFQKRMVTLLAHAGVSAWAEADTILQMEKFRGLLHNEVARTVITAEEVPGEMVWLQSVLAEK